MVGILLLIIGLKSVDYIRPDNYVSWDTIYLNQMHQWPSWIGHSFRDFRVSTACRHVPDVIIETLTSFTPLSLDINVENKSALRMQVSHIWISSPGLKDNVSYYLTIFFVCVVCVKESLLEYLLDGVLHGSAK
jgi:hypothetical protein